MASTTAPPICPYCQLSVGENEYDVESGGYFSTHFACTSESATGRYLVFSHRHDGGQRQHHGRYTRVLRAMAKARDLAEWNYRGTSFVVVDLGPEAPAGHRPELPTLRYDHVITYAGCLHQGRIDSYPEPMVWETREHYNARTALNLDSGIWRGLVATAVDRGNGELL